MKLTALFFLFIGFTSLQPSIGDSETYSSKDGKFRVTFPGAYEETVGEGEDQKTVKINFVQGEHILFASYTLHETEITDHQDMAEVSLDSFVEAVNGDLISKSEWKVKGNSGLQSVMTIESEEKIIKIDYRVVLVGQLQYQLVSIAPTDDYDTKMSDKFFKSFQITK
jgi:hypothetical protein